MTDEEQEPIAFKVTTSDGKTTNYGGTFGFAEGGVLKIVQHDGPTLYLAPGIWLEIVDVKERRKRGRVTVL